MGNIMPKSAALRDSLSGSKAAPQSEAAMLTVPEACRYLRVSKWTLYRLMQAGKLKTVKLGNRRLVRMQTIAQLLDKLESDHYA